jgi:hypothetical protein
LRIRPHQHHLPTKKSVGKDGFYRRVQHASMWFNDYSMIHQKDPKRMVVASKLVVQMRKTSEKKKKLNHVLTTKQLRPNPTLKSTVIHLPPIDFTCRAGKLESLEKIPWLKYGFEPRIQHK